MTFKLNCLKRHTIGWGEIQLSENEKRMKQDPFTRMMFGSRSEEHSSKQDWMFGSRTEERSSKQDWILGRKTAEHEEKNSAQAKVEQILENVDLDGLMNNFDTLMSSVGELKPLMKKAGPFLQKFLKNKE